MGLHRTRPRPDRHCSLAPRRLVARRDADAFANKFKRKWTRLCFCDIMVTEMRKRLRYQGLLLSELRVSEEQVLGMLS